MKLVILLALALLATVARADPPPDTHQHWRNTAHQSHYVLYDHASRTWVETIDCRAVYRFALVRNEMNAITLHDASRGMTIKLDYDGMWLMPAGQSGFSFYQPGKFDKRTHFEHVDQSGTWTGTLLKRDACRWEEWMGGDRPAFTFQQIAVDDAEVQLLDGSRPMWVQLHGERMSLKDNPLGGFAFFKWGRWRG